MQHTFQLTEESVQAKVYQYLQSKFLQLSIIIVYIHTNTYVVVEPFKNPSDAGQISVSQSCKKIYKLMCNSL